MAKTLNLSEAKTRLSELVEEAAAGEEIVIAKAGVPRARLMPLRPRHHRRKPGGYNALLPLHRTDPFGRLLAPQALSAGLTMVSHDSVFEHYRVPVIRT